MKKLNCNRIYLQKKKLFFTQKLLLPAWFCYEATGTRDVQIHMQALFQDVVTKKEKGQTMANRYIVGKTQE